MIAAKDAAELFHDWMLDLQKAGKNHFDTLGAAVSTWLHCGGVSEIYADYTLFLQMIIILLADDKIGLPSGTLQTCSGLGKRSKPLPAYQPGDTEWTFHFEPDVFLGYVYKANHPVTACD